RIFNVTQNSERSRDMRDSAWRYITILDLPFSLIFDTLLLPLDIHHGPYE
ncbi:YceK/YidQ family lipoprotein, partial [Salmonella enterica]|nr:YceK/YidQ family lipoprotein [Salmonella enterica]